MARHDPSQGLPPPDPEAAAHSARLRAHIETRVAGGAALSFARFMELALYAPGLGYYSAGSRKFGAAGDFVTAPELSSLFGRCLARSAREVLEQTGGGEILEFGAGSGALAADLLLELDALGAAPERYAILEVSGELRARQRETLAARCPGLAGRVQWLEALPGAINGVVLANEVLDALPVERFRKSASGGVEQACVRSADGALRWHWRPAPADLAAAVAAIEADVGGPLPAGYTSEVCLLLGPWVRSLADVLGRGYALLIDYGYPRREYYHPQRRAGTLMCHYRHRAHDDPLMLPGLQDITAHVDFSAVAASAADAGLELAGFTSQAHYLLAGGLVDILEQSDPADARAHLELARQAKLLTLPGEMGERFKVMGLSRGMAEPPSGFAGPDLRGRL